MGEGGGGSSEGNDSLQISFFGGAAGGSRVIIPFRRQGVRIVSFLKIQIPTHRLIPAIFYPSQLSAASPLLGCQEIGDHVARPPSATRVAAMNAERGL